MEPNQIYQYSILNALMSGLAEDGTTAKELQSKGCTQGIGTFTHIDGELVMLDNEIFQLQPGGKARKVDLNDKIPFVMAIKLKPQMTRDDITLSAKSDVDGELMKFSDTKNLFMAYRIEGSFEYLKCRTPQGQEYPRQSLSEVGQHQSVEEFSDIKGTIVGFRSPANWQGITVAGEHMHFVSSDKKHGGHVLELRTNGGAKMHMAVANNIHIELPTSKEFNQADFVTDSDAVQKVEG